MITNTEIKKLISLAKLEVAPIVEKKLVGWLSETVDYISILDSTNTLNISSTTQVTSLTNVFREDTPSTDLDFKLSGTLIKTIKVINRDTPMQHGSIPN